MSIDKKGFRYRLSNVLAWFGLLNLGFWFQQAVVEGAQLLIVSVGSWLFLGVINYLMVGSLRLIPWWDIENQE